MLLMDRLTVCVRVTSVGLSLLSRPGRLGPVQGLHLHQVGGFLLAVERCSGHDGAAERVDVEEAPVATVVPQDHIVDLDTKETPCSPRPSHSR